MEEEMVGIGKKRTKLSSVRLNEIKLTQSHGDIDIDGANVN
jgi:hypothetical protein